MTATLQLDAEDRTRIVDAFLDIDNMLLEDAVAAEAAGDFVIPEAAGFLPDFDAAFLKA
ncbi:MAG TPA: hypothetical protein VEK57_05690 [Thermoanaerobaculia bacterium]|nr:hypothetical protein [Thermoanaerobaculia bacterium]